MEETAGDEEGDGYRLLSGGGGGTGGGGDGGAAAAAAGGAGGGGGVVEESYWGNWDPIPRIRVVERSRFVYVTLDVLV